MINEFGLTAEENSTASTGWLCPDIDYMALQYYFKSDQDYSAYSYSLYYCDDAARLLNYTDTNCEQDHAISN